MATVETKLLTAEEFWDWANSPENAEFSFELDQGKVVSMPPPGELHGALCGLITYLLWKFVIQRGRGGYVCGNDTGLLVQRDPDTVRGPDVMLFDEPSHLDGLSTKFSERIPKLIVEVLSPNDTPGKTNRRISQYLKRGVPLVWVVDAEERLVTVYQSGNRFHTAEEGDELTGEAVLPELRLPVVDLFTLPSPHDGE